MYCQKPLNHLHIFFHLVFVRWWSLLKQRARPRMLASHVLNVYTWCFLPGHTQSRDLCRYLWVGGCHKWCHWLCLLTLLAAELFILQSHWWWCWRPVGKAEESQHDRVAGPMLASVQQSSPMLALRPTLRSAAVCTQSPETACNIETLKIIKILRKGWK